MDQNTSQVNTANATEAPQEDPKNSSQAVESTNVKTYTQAEVDDIMAAVKATATKKVSRKFEGVDVDLYNNLLQKEEQSKLEEQKKKGEFEKILKEQAEKANSKINQLTSELTKIKVDGALLNSAASKKAINPEQVVRLVRDQVKMSDTGEVEIVDPLSGQTRYTETGDPMTVDGIVSDFLKSNPHFQQAGPAGGGSASNTTSEGAKQVDISKLDLSDPVQYEQYKSLRAKVYNAQTKKIT